MTLDEARGLAPGTVIHWWRRMEMKGALKFKRHEEVPVLRVTGKRVIVAWCFREVAVAPEFLYPLPGGESRRVERVMVGDKVLHFEKEG